MQDIRQREATQIDLIVTDGHESILAAVTELFAATPRQRYVVHKQRNVMNAIPHRERKEMSTELSANISLLELWRARWQMRTLSSCWPCAVG